MKNRNVALIVTLGALTAFGPFSIDTYLPALPDVARDLAAPIATIELSVSSFFLGMALGQLFVGPISDRFGRKPPLLVGVALYLVATVVCMVAPGAPTLIAFRFVQALGGAAGGVIARAIVRDVFPAHETARIFSLLTLVMGVAPILAPSVGGILLAAFGWRAIFAFLTLFGALALLSTFSLPETRGVDATVSLRPLPLLRNYFTIFKQPDFLRFSLVGSVASAGMFAYIAGSSFVYIEYFRVSPTVYAWIFGANALGFVSASQINRAWLSRRGSAEILLRVSPVQAAAGVCLCAAALLGWGGLPGLLIFNFLFVATIGFILPNTTALALLPFKRGAGAASALLGSVQSVIATLAAAAVSALHNGTPVPMTGVMMTCGLVAFALLQTARRAAPARLEVDL